MVRCPAWVSIDVANAVLFSSFAVTWSGATHEPVWCLVGVVIWLLRLPSAAVRDREMRIHAGRVRHRHRIHLARGLRVLEGTGASRWCRAGRRSSCSPRTAPCSCCARRSARCCRLAGQGNVFAYSGWLELLSLEALLFTVSIAFILLAMAKDAPNSAIANSGGDRRAQPASQTTGAASWSRARRRSAWAMDARPATAVLLIRPRPASRADQRPARPCGRRSRAADFQPRPPQPVVGSSAGLVGRWGGDEFAAVLYDTSRDRAAAMANSSAGFQKARGGDREPVGATASMGIAVQRLPARSICRRFWCRPIRRSIAPSRAGPQPRQYGFAQFNVDRRASAQSSAQACAGRCRGNNGGLIRRPQWARRRLSVVFLCWMRCESRAGYAA